MTQRLLLDCDPGHDDAIAILLAAHAPGAQLEAITTVAGNQTVAMTARNALQVCALAGIHAISVAAGMDRPLVRELQVAERIHGASGLGDADLPEPQIALAPQHAVDLLIERLLAAKHGLTLVATGPLTNVATAIRREPRILPHIRRIVLMGGAIGLGNWTPAAEFNIAIDPEAAHIVFTCGQPITMVGLDVTHQALATANVRERIRALHTPVGDFVEGLLDYYAERYASIYGFPAPPVHDACAVAVALDPTLLHAEPMRVDIELRGEFTAGRTVCDRYGVTGRPPNAEVGLELDVPRFWDLLIGVLATY
ncbi:MAG: nucleoside hydrolase [Ktedonobacterales bacterium]